MIGRRLSKRYEILNLIGEGATAVVYRARDHKLNRTVALKVLLAQSRPATQQRFLQEALAAAQLHHPNIMAIFDQDEDDGMQFLVVEYIEGTPLENMIPADPAVVIRTGAQIARALDYAHARGIVHRDIKPANIIVTRDDQAKLMDLGLALPRAAKRVTAAGMIIGTPAYLSPEQAQGLPLDYRTDIYSLGVVLFEMVTGQLPFSEDDIQALLLQHVRQPAPAPRSLKPELPPELDAVILKALEKSPARRFQSAGAMADALETIKLGAPADAADAETARSTQTTAGHPARGPVRIALADDHQILLTALVGLLAEQPDFLVVGQAGDGARALQMVAEQQPDVLLLDLNMPVRSGLEVLPEIRRAAPATKVLILTGRNEDFYIMQALRAGAQGYLLKLAPASDLIDGIHRVMQGQMVLGAGVAEKVVSGMLGGPPLTEDERRLMLYVAAGLNNEAIAARMERSIIVVTELLARAMDKLGAADRNGAALAAIRAGYILPDELQTL
jgi:DNA-binding NarL/FixJ family response regulator/tRNA A-37 threonylcarbamoyl transferase component Bud32